MGSSSNDRHYPARPFAAVGVVVWRGDEVLVIRRARPPRKDQWGLVGGAVELGETHFEAAKREVKEETGIEAEPFAIITAIDSVSRDAEGKVEFHYSIVEVNARYMGGDITPGDEALEARWISPVELKNYQVWDQMHRVVALADTQRRILAKP
jgi:8-oxo-dGTP diphosphatase